MRQRTKVGVVAATLLALLAGCGSSSEPPNEPHDTSEASTSSQAPPPPSSTHSPTATATERSNTEKLDDDAKAEVAATVETYLQTLNTAYQTGDTTELKTLADEKCTLCASVAAYIDDAYGQGGRIENCTAATPQDVVVNDLVVLDDGTVQVRQVPYSAKIDVTECITYDGSGAEVAREPAGTESVQFLVNQEGDGWIVRAWEIENQG